MRKIKKSIFIFSILLVLVGCNTKSKRTITFESQGGSLIDTVEVISGEATILPVPNKEGHTFIGWFTGFGANDVQITNQTPILSNLTLYAKWQINTYQITFHTNSENQIDPLSFVFQEDLILPASIHKSGYHFEGWYTDDKYTSLFDLTLMPAYDLMLYAKWNPNFYTITFNTNEGSLIEDKRVLFDSIIGTLDTPIREGHTFQGWFLEEELNTIFDYINMPDYDFTLYAKWKQNDFYFKFDTDGGSDIEDEKIEIGALYYTLPKPRKEGHLFVGWMYHDRFVSYPFTTIEFRDIELKAVYIKLEINHFYFEVTHLSDSKLVLDLYLSEGSRIHGYQGQINFDNYCLIPKVISYELGHRINYDQRGNVIFNYSNIEDTVNTSVPLISLEFSIRLFNDTLIQLIIEEAFYIDEMYQIHIEKVITEDIIIRLRMATP